jgi:protein tyrosine phosphatase
MVAKTNKGKSHAGRKHHVQSRKNRNRKMHSKKTHMKNHKHKKTSRLVKLRVQRGGFDDIIREYLKAVKYGISLFDIKLMLVYTWLNKNLTTEQDTSVLYMLKLTEHDRVKPKNAEYLSNLDKVKRILEIDESPIKIVDLDDIQWINFIDRTNTKTQDLLKILSSNDNEIVMLLFIIYNCLDNNGYLRDDRMSDFYKYKYTGADSKAHNDLYENTQPYYKGQSIVKETGNQQLVFNTEQKRRRSGPPRKLGESRASIAASRRNVRRINNNKLASESSLTLAQDKLPLTHYWFRIWLDKRPPPFTEYCNFIKELYGDMVTNGGLTLIHCSAGVGRTGVTYVTLYLLFKYGIDPRKKGFPLESPIILQQNIFDTIKNARDSRMLLVQTLEQFNFILNCFGYSKKDEDEDGYKDIIKQYLSLNKNPNSLSTVEASNVKNKPKNRYKDILPYDITRVHLDNNGYINASFAPYPREVRSIPNLSDLNKGFILAQGPNPDTIQDFLDMIRKYEVRRIVMVTGLIEPSGIKCINYLNIDDDEPGDVNENFNKKPVDFINYGKITQYEYKIYPGSRPESPHVSRA